MNLDNLNFQPRWPSLVADLVLCVEAVVGVLPRSCQDFCDGAGRGDSYCQII